MSSIYLILDNLVSVHLLGMASIKILFDGDIVNLSKNKVFVGKGYDADGLFILNVNQVINENRSSSCAYLVDSINAWHGRPGHLNLSYIKKIKEYGIINSISEANMDNVEFVLKLKSPKNCVNPQKEKPNSLVWYIMFWVT